MGIISIKWASSSVIFETVGSATLSPYSVAMAFWKDLYTLMKLGLINAFSLDSKFYYICVILDIYSLKVIAYKISRKNSTQFISGTFRLVYADRRPKSDLIFHSDHGTQYTSHSFQALLKKCHVNQSFSPSGKPYHNAVMESFFSSMKKEELYRTNYHSANEFKERIKHYMDIYNIERPHSTLSYKSPNAYESLFYERESNKMI